MITVPRFFLGLVSAWMIGLTGLGLTSPAHALQADTTPPSGYSVSTTDPAINLANLNTLDFTMNGVEIGALYFFSVTSSAGSDGLSGVITSSPQPTNNVISLNHHADGILTVALQLTDLAGNVGALVTTQLVKDTVVPTVALTSGTADPVSGAFTVTATFSEDVTGFDLSDFTVGNGVASNFQTISAGVYTATITPAADGLVTVDVAANAAQDTVGNPSAVASQFSITNDGVAPTIVSAFRVTGSTGYTNSDTLVATINFSEFVTNISDGDFSATGLTGATVSVSASSGTSVNITISGGDLASFNGLVTPIVVTGHDMTDLAGNLLTNLNILNNAGWAVDNLPPDPALSSTSTDPVTGAFTLAIFFSEALDKITNGLDASELVVTNGTISNFVSTTSEAYTATITPIADGLVTVDLPAGVTQDAAGNLNTASAQFTRTQDTVAPTVALTSGSSDPVSGAFTVTATFSEAVTGFAIGDFTVGNGAVSDFQAISTTVYTATITPAANGLVTVDVAAGVAQDAAGNPNSASAQLTITNDETAPTASITLPGATAQGPFVASFAFSEDVTGFDISDVVIANGAASGFVTADARTYSATITPASPGALTVSLATGAAQDNAGNASTADSQALVVVIPALDARLDLGGAVTDPTTVSTAVALPNPGSQPLAYTASIDVNWAAIAPASGTLPGSGSRTLNIALTAGADQLAAGTHNAAVTVTDSNSSMVVATIPVVLQVAARFGSLQVVATTPGGLQGDVTFTYASTDTDIDGLSLTTAGGTASSASFRKIFGRYDITQSLPAGWELDTLTCAGDTDGGSVIDMANGHADIDLDANETIVCTFANSRADSAIRVATTRAINNYLVRRADRIISSQPDIASRLRGRNETSPGSLAVDANPRESRMTVKASLAGMRNHARSNGPRMPGDEAPENSPFDLWMAGDYTTLSDDRSGDRAEGEFGIVQIGADFALDSRTVLGVMVQRDWMDETQETIAAAAGGIAPARISGSGWMAGPYIARQMDNGVIIDLLALYGQSENDINPLGFYTDAFSTNRFLLRAKVSGEWANGPWRVRPSASLTHFEETQKAYLDSLGVAIPKQSIALGRFTAGPEIAYRTEASDGGFWELHGQLNASYDYNPGSLMDDAGRLFETGHFRADSVIGVRRQIGDGIAASFQLNMSGLGESDFEASGARFEVRIPFGG